jgi:hypothetical protein|tara:strand:- start:167 stop:379 length:213 start_codon:yes stop_codon:yes gene_type:complete
MDKLNGYGLFVGATSWVALNFYMSISNNCVEYKACQSDDFMMHGFIMLGMAAPCILLAFFVSLLFKDKGK